MENRYIDEAWNNRPHRIYGFNLKPFCLYYLHLLQSIKSPVLRADAPVYPKDLFIASEICSSRYSSEGYTLDLALRPGWFRLKRNQVRLLTCFFHSEIQKWREYYEDYLVVAKKWQVVEVDGSGAGGKKRSDLDRVMETLAGMIFATHWSEEKIMMMPIGKLYAYSDYFAIQQGAKIQFFTDRDEEIEKRDKERLAALAAAEEEANGTGTDR